MTAIELLDENYKPEAVEWLIDGVLPTTGLAAVHGPARSGRTSLTVSLVKALASPAEHTILTRSANMQTDVLVLTGQRRTADRWWEATRDLGTVTVALADLKDPGVWTAGAKAAQDRTIGLAVVDGMSQVSPSEVSTVAASIRSLARATLVVLPGNATSPTTHPDGWASEICAGLHLSGKLGLTNAVTLYGDATDPTSLNVAWRDDQRGFVALDSDGREIPSLVSSLSERQVHDLGIRARFLQGLRGGTLITAERLLAEDHAVTVQICGRELSPQVLASAIDGHPDAWNQGLRPSYGGPLPDEPPF